MIDPQGKFYLGRLHDPQSETQENRPLLYDPADLTTHAVVVGMTGSGKTGLCLDLLEEAALQNIPALMVDPKGDITNALLHFPKLRPSDFQPWINADQARRAGKTVEEAAEETAVLWRNGLNKWDIQPERIQALADSAAFSIYTPGSNAGIPLSILASLTAPAISWEEHKESLREQISGIVTALLGLIGFKDIDPVRSREHILLANIFETAWSQGQDMDLGELIMQIQSPPFEKLGVFEVDRFFPEKDRLDLALALNNILASPAFQSWIEGEPLDIGRLLYDESGKPRHTIFYIAHLAEAERMFFVALFYSAVENWMRSQKGTTSLRALVYFDEIFGYLPPVGNPPSKEPMLRMLKQARAFGVGMVLASQNPVDIDYKALSNAGTWFIGKLGTDQDKQRLLDGLASTASGGLNRREYDELISAIGKRTFLLRNVHAKQPILFQTRWAMNYLAGPATRKQIPALNALAGRAAPVEPLTVEQEEAVTAVSTTAVSPTPAPIPSPSVKTIKAATDLPGSETRPSVPARVAEYFLPAARSFEEAMGVEEAVEPAGLLYRPVLLAQADIRILNRKYNLDLMLKRTAVVQEPDHRGIVRWEEHLGDPIDVDSFNAEPEENGRFLPLDAPLNDAKLLRAMKSDFVDWLYNKTAVAVSANEQLKLYAGPNISDGDFKRLCVEAAEAQATIEMKKIEDRYETKFEAIEKRLAREERELREDEMELSQRKQEELATYAGTFFSLFSKRRRSLSSSLAKKRMTKQAKLDVEESIETIAEFKKELAELSEDLERDLADARQKWADIAAAVTELTVTPYKKNIIVESFGVAWRPCFLAQIDGKLTELSGD